MRKQTADGKRRKRAPAQFHRQEVFSVDRIPPEPTPRVMGARQFTELRVWQEAVNLAEEIYAGTEGFPAEEKYGLVAQMRRAVASIPSNIAEGFSRSLPRERARFYEIAKSSAEELRSEILLSRRLRFPPIPASVEARLDSACKMLYRLRQLVLSDLK